MIQLKQNLNNKKYDITYSSKLKINITSMFNNHIDVTFEILELIIKAHKNIKVKIRNVCGEGLLKPDLTIIFFTLSYSLKEFQEA